MSQLLLESLEADLRALILQYDHSHDGIEAAPFKCFDPQGDEIQWNFATTHPRAIRDSSLSTDERVTLLNPQRIEQGHGQGIFFLDVVVDSKGVAYGRLDRSRLPGPDRKTQMIQRLQHMVAQRVERIIAESGNRYVGEILNVFDAVARRLKAAESLAKHELKLATAWRVSMEAKFKRQRDSESRELFDRAVSVEQTARRAANRATDRTNSWNYRIERCDSW